MTEPEITLFDLVKAYGDWCTSKDVFGENHPETMRVQRKGVNLTLRFQKQMGEPLDTWELDPDWWKK